MCGIAGIFNFPAAENSPTGQQLTAMLTAIRYRGLTKVVYTLVRRLAWTMFV